MPIYRVLAAADDVIRVCSLMVETQDGKIDYLKIKNMNAKLGKALVGKEIQVTTTNKEIIPRDIAPLPDVPSPILSKEGEPETKKKIVTTGLFCFSCGKPIEEGEFCDECKEKAKEDAEED